MLLVQFSCTNWHVCYIIVSASSGDYMYEERSDSCMKLTSRKVLHDQADDICAEEHGYLAVLNTSDLQLLATRMLQASGHEEAWVSSPSYFEKYANNKGRLMALITKNSRLCNVLHVLNFEKEIMFDAYRL